jgi:hypothetical protein
VWQIQWLLQLIPDSIFVWITYALFLTGIVLYIASKLVTIIPIINRYKIAAELAGVVTLIVAAYFYGGVEYRQMIADLKARVAVAEQQSKDANSALEKKTREKVQVIKETVYVNKTIIKETAGRQIDSQCVLPRSAVSLHNGASGNQISRGPESTDGTPSSVKASELLETVVENYGACHENAEKLRGWQEWYSTQKKIVDAIAK